MTKETYLHYCNTILKDQATYRLLSNLNPSPATQATEQDEEPFQPHYIMQGYQELEDILRRHGQLTKSYKSNHQHHGIPNLHTNPRSKLATALLQLQHSNKLQHAAKFYILLKMHKPTISGRPIVNCINTMTYHASKYLSNILNPIVAKLHTVVHSSLEALLKINDIKLARNNIDHYSLLSADVKNLYPSIPITYGLKAVRSVLNTHRIPDVDFIIDLLAWVLNNNYIQFNNQTYLQVSGTAMGTPCAPPYANIVLYYLEYNLVAKYNPTAYLRYLDDIFAVFETEAQSKQFVAEFNRQLEDTITLDSVVHSTSNVVFLDLQLSINPNPNGNPTANPSIDCKLYQKPSNKYLYIPPKSAHKYHIFSNFILNELRRYRLYNTSPVDFHMNKLAFYNRLKARGYSDRFLLPLFQQTLPTRQTLLDEAQEKRNSMQKSQYQLSDPVVILNLPKVQHISVSPTTLFELPETIRQHDYYRVAFPKSSRTRPIIANRSGKSLLRLIDVDKFAPPRR